MIREVNEHSLRRLALRGMVTAIICTITGMFFIAYLGGPAPAVMGLVMVVAVAGSAALAGAAWALRSAILRAKEQLR